MYSLFTRIGALQVVGALAYVARAKIGALVLGPGGVGLVSIIDQFVLLMLQLFAFAIPFTAVKVLSKAHSESIESFKAAYAGLLRLLLILGSIGAAVGIALILLRPNWVSASLTNHTALVAIGLLALPAMILHAFFRNVPAAAMQPVTAAVWDAITAASMSGAVVLGILLAGVPGYFVGALIGCVAVSVAYYSYLARRFNVSIVSTPSSIRSLLKANPAFLELSVASYIGSFVTPLALLVVRITVLNNLGVATAGILQAAIGISLGINLVLNPLNGLLLTPLVNRKIADSSKIQETQQFQKKLLLAIAIVALPPILFPDLMVLALYSSHFVEAADTLYWFVLGQAMMQVQGIATALMIGLDRLKAYAAVMVAGHRGECGARSCAGAAAGPFRRGFSRLHKRKYAGARVIRLSARARWLPYRSRSRPVHASTVHRPRVGRCVRRHASELRDRESACQIDCLRRSIGVHRARVARSK